MVKAMTVHIHKICVSHAGGNTVVTNLSNEPVMCTYSYTEERSGLRKNSIPGYLLEVNQAIISLVCGFVYENIPSGVTSRRTNSV